MTAKDVKNRLTGVFGFPITPFRKDLSLDLDALARNVAEMVKHPFCAMVAAGGTGELYSMTVDEIVDVVRVTVQALAAVLGGCQSLHTNSMDEALALPTERAVRIALRTQQVLAHESGVADVADAFGGAFALERLTDDIEEAARVYITKIDELGGAVAAIPFMQREIQDAAYRYQKEVEDHSRIVVGVNEYVTDDLPPANLFQVDAAVGAALAERVARARAGRDRDATARALDTLEAAARGRDNLLPLLISAVEAGVTLGEICDRLRGVFGIHRPSVTF